MRLLLCRRRRRMTTPAAVKPAGAAPGAAFPAAVRPAAPLQQINISSLSTCRMSVLKNLRLLQTEHITFRAAKTPLMWTLMKTVIFCWTFLVIKTIVPALLSGISGLLSPTLKFLMAIKSFPAIQKSILTFAMMGTTTIISIPYRMAEISIQVLSRWIKGSLPLCAFPLPNWSCASLTLIEIRCPVLLLLLWTAKKLLPNSPVVVTENAPFLSNCMREIASSILLS